MASMKEVAKLSGVSVATVSRVLNGNAPVTSAKRVRVEAAIKSVDYRPNLLAKGLRKKSGHLIGYVVPEIQAKVFPYYIRYIEEFVRKRGFSMILGNTNDDPKQEQTFINSLIQRDVDGIIFSRGPREDHPIALPDTKHIPIVVLRTIEHENVPNVGVDNYHAGKLVAEHFLGLGHRKVALIQGPMTLALCRERTRGFTETLRAHGCELLKSMVGEGPFTVNAGAEATARIFQTGQPTAIWAHNDDMAFGAVKQLRFMGLAVPQDVSLVGMDNLPIAEFMDPGLTTVMQPYEHLCSKAVEMLFREIEGEHVEKKSLLLKPKLVVRDSTRKL
jgi:DNA-binding LacI/PurR family transcriptional regulator